MRLSPMVAISEIDGRKIREVCETYPIRRLSIFGSIVSGDFRPDSDVDVLVEWMPDAVVGFRIFDLERDLSSIFGDRTLDIVNAKYLNPRLRERVLRSAEEVYAKG